MKIRVTMLFLVTVVIAMTGCFQGGQLGIDENQYQLSIYNRKCKTIRKIGHGSLAGSIKTEYNDIIYLSDEAQAVQVWIRLGYDSKLKYTGKYSLRTPRLGDIQSPGDACCIIKNNGTIYECVSGSIEISREGTWTLACNVVNAEARIRGDIDTENNKQINLQYTGELLRGRIGLLLQDEP